MATGTTRRGLRGIALLVLLAVAFVGSSVLFTAALHGPRLDLTENGLYTLSAGTRHMVRKLQQPVTLRFFYSRRALQGDPTLATYGRRVRELLQEVADASDGHVKLEVVDPTPYSDEEDQATDAGLQSIPLGPGGTNAFLGLVGSAAGGGTAAIPFFQPAKERLLEYDVARLIHQLGVKHKPKIALMTTLPMTLGFDPVNQRMRQPWVIVTQMQQAFEVHDLPTSATEIPADVSLLMLVHPKGLSDATLYAIDQFVMRGGRLLLFVDPSAEQDVSGANPMNPLDGDGRASDLEPLLKAWGVQFDPKEVIGDDKYALTVSAPGGAPVRHLGFLGMDEHTLDPSDPITAGLGLVNFATAGWLDPIPSAHTHFEPLVRSSTDAAPIAASRFAEPADPERLYDGFKPTGKRYVLAARISGPLESAYPDGPPKTVKLAKGVTPLTKTQKDANLVVVADTDMLADQMWTRSSSFLGQTFVQAWADNGDFVLNALDNLGGSDDLISIRGRASFLRPFTRVEALRRNADERLRDEARELQARLEATEKKLEQLQASRGKDASAVLTPEQEAEVAKFRDERGRIRRQLREVRHSLNQQIEALGTRIKLLDIVLAPLLLVGLTWLVAAWARRRR